MSYINWFLIVFAPIITFIGIRFLKKKIINYLSTISILFVVAFFSSIKLEVYFNSQTCNEILFSFFYLGLCHLLWLPLTVKNKGIKIFTQIITIIPMIIFFNLGVIGLFPSIYNDFFLKTFNADITTDISSNYIIGATKMGNALEPDRVRIHVFEKLSTLPFKRKFVTKEYTDFYGDINLIEFTYDKYTQELEIKSKQEHPSFIRKIKLFN